MTLSHERLDLPTGTRKDGALLESTAVYVGELHEIGEGEAWKVTDPSLPEAVAVFNSGGNLYALADRCSHGSASLAEGWVENCRVACPLHFSEFDLRTGEPCTLPAMAPVNTYVVDVRGDSIYVIAAAAKASRTLSEGLKE